MSFDFVVTAAGRAAIVNAQHTGTDPVEITQIGFSPTAITPAPGMTALAGEIKRITEISGEVVAVDTIHVTAVDDSADVYSLRSVALYLEDGTLFAIYGQPAVILEKSAGSLAALAIDVIFADISAASLTFSGATFSNPPATTERLGVVELATLAEAISGHPNRVPTAAIAIAAVMNWVLSQDGAGSGLDADLLDGQQGAWYADIAARLGFTPANRAGDTFTGAVRRDANFGLDLSAGDPQLLLDAGDFLLWQRGSNALRLAIGGVLGSVWHSASDGSGSGLDADLLDGRDGSDYLRVVAQDPSETAGYRVYSDGFKKCWGRVSVPANAQGFSVLFPLPVAHPFASFSNVTGSGGLAGNDINDNAPEVASTSPSGFTLNSAANGSVTWWWKAWGY